MRTSSLLWTSLLLATSSAGCATQSGQSSAPYSSTRGTILVQMASVTAVRELRAPDQRTGANQGAMELSLRFDDGTAHSFNIEPGQIFRPGDRVKVTSHRGNIRITHE